MFDNVQNVMENIIKRGDLTSTDIDIAADKFTREIFYEGIKKYELLSEIIKPFRTTKIRYQNILAYKEFARMVERYEFSNPQIINDLLFKGLNEVMDIVDVTQKEMHMKDENEKLGKKL